MIVIQWVVTIFLWIITAAFAISDLLCILAVIHHRKDREFRFVIFCVIVLFALFACAGAMCALEVGRGL